MRAAQEEKESHVGRSSLPQVLIQLFTVIRSAYLSRLSAPFQDSFLPSFLPLGSD